MHQKKELTRFARTSGPQMAWLSLVRKTTGKLTNMQIAPKKLQSEETRPVRNKARSSGNMNRAQTWSITNAIAAMAYL